MADDNNVKDVEEKAEDESEAVASRYDEETGLGDENEVDAEETEKIVGERNAIPAEVDAINTDNETADRASSDINEDENQVEE